MCVYQSDVYLSGVSLTMYSTMHELASTRLLARKRRYIPAGTFSDIAHVCSFYSKDRPVSPVSESTMSQPQAISRSPGTPTHTEFAQSPKVSASISRYVHILRFGVAFQSLRGLICFREITK